VGLPWQGYKVDFFHDLFTTSAGPTITTTTPGDLDNVVDIRAQITFTFSEDMDPSTLVRDDGQVAGRRWEFIGGRYGFL